LRPGPAGLDIPVPVLAGTLGRCPPSAPGPAAGYRLPCEDEEPPPAEPPLPGPCWLELVLALPEGQDGQTEPPTGRPPRMLRDLRSLRIEAEGAEFSGEEQRLPFASPESARHLALQLLAHPAAIERLHDLHDSHEGFGLADWLALGLFSGELLIIVRPLPDWLRTPGSGPVKPKPGGGGKKPGKTVETHWIEIVLKDERGEPVRNRAYEIIAADKSRHTGTTDRKGRGRVDGIVPGPCEVFFPELDDDEWKRA
jgi:hypothetical protein